MPERYTRPGACVLLPQSASALAVAITIATGLIDSALVLQIIRYYPDTRDRTRAISLYRQATMIGQATGALSYG